MIKKNTNRPYSCPSLLRRKVIPHRRPSVLIIIINIIALTLLSTEIFSQKNELDSCNIVWTSQSKNSGESMPCGGGDIGLNVWVENGDVLFYISKSGTFDENNAFLKPGRVRVKLSPNPFEGKIFKQELILKDGYVNITGSDGNLSAQINIWVDVFNPVIHIDITTGNAVDAEVIYETWRYRDRINKSRENNANSYKWTKDQITTYKDVIAFKGNQVLFYHQQQTSAFSYLCIR